MPAVGFICEDGGKCKFEECFKECRLKGKINPVTGRPYVPCGRCLTVPTLRTLAKQRKWSGKPSTTQLLKGTREAYLTITKDYYFKPYSLMFALLGTGTHEKLEGGMTMGDLGEKRLDDGISTGAFDYWSPEDGGTLYDYKTYGSFVVAKHLGITTEKVQTGHYKNGKPRYQTIFKYDGYRDMFDLAVQMNDYRMKIKKCLGKDTANMVCEAIVKDGNTYMAKQRGILENAYMIPVNKISDHWITKYMTRKANDLTKAIETKTLPPPCRYRETWGGRKCENFCPVAEFCNASGKDNANEKKD